MQKHEQQKQYHKIQECRMLQRKHKTKKIHDVILVIKKKKHMCYLLYVTSQVTFVFNTHGLCLFICMFIHE